KRCANSTQIKNKPNEPRCANSTQIKNKPNELLDEAQVFVWRPNGPGTGLFSRGLVTPVSWALERFTAVFGMGTGGTTPLSPPGPIGRHASRVANRSVVEQTVEGPPLENMDPADLMKREIEARALGH